MANITCCYISSIKPCKINSTQICSLYSYLISFIRDFLLSMSLEWIEKFVQTKCERCPWPLQAKCSGHFFLQFLSSFIWTHTFLPWRVVQGSEIWQGLVMHKDIMFPMEIKKSFLGFWILMNKCNVIPMTVVT
jgi:hypothetical protein